MQTPNSARLSSATRGIYYKVNGTGRNSISTSCSQKLRMFLPCLSFLSSFAPSCSPPFSDLNASPPLLPQHIEKRESGAEADARRKEAIRMKRIDGFDRTEKLIFRIIAYWENFSLHAFENTTQNFFQPTSLSVGEGMVDCSCCYTIRRDVSFSCPSPFFPPFLLIHFLRLP